jgi:preprotein translocase subunit SecA
LGTKREIELYKNVYFLDSVFIPPHKTKIFKEYEAIVVKKSEQEWINEIKNSIKNETNKGRSVLVICETIDTLNKIQENLSRSGFNSANIIKYSRSDLKEENKIISEEISSGKIILATNLAGRGLDLKLDQSLKLNGGLHVCVTFLPINLRVENQAFGRTSRCGDKGTAQLVIHYATETEKFGFNSNLIQRSLKAQEGLGGNKNAKFQENKTIDDFKRLRAKHEEGILESAEKEIFKIRLKDELFVKFCQLINNDIDKLNEDENMQKAIEERWGIWLSDYELENTTFTNQVDFEKYKKEINANFEAFRNGILGDFESDKVFNNSFLK